MQDLYRISDIGLSIGKLWPFAWKLHKRRGLRVWILSLLTRSPKTGAEIMDSIEEMSQGWWRPSPGSIYPLLDEMSRDGLIKKREDGRYELTEKSNEEIAWPFGMPGRRTQTIEDMLKEIDGYTSYFEDLRKSDMSKIQPYADGIGKLGERLSTLAREAR